LSFSRARYDRESEIMNARKKTETWNAGMKEHLEALSEVTSRGVDFEAFRKFMEVRMAHWDALWEEYTKPRWARWRMNLYCGKQRAVATFFNQLSALKENQSERLVVTYGAGR
jgi:4-alpha-glucanotransferase